MPYGLIENLPDTQIAGMLYSEKEETMNTDHDMLRPSFLVFFVTLISPNHREHGGRRCSWHGVIPSRSRGLLALRTKQRQTPRVNC